MNPEKTPPPVDTTPHLDALIVSHETHAKTHEHQLDTLIRQNEKNNPAPILEAHLQKLGDIHDALKQKDAPVADEHTITLRGLKGEPGDTPTDERLLALIRPLIPTPIPGRTPTAEELLTIIRPLIPKPLPGKPGNTPTRQELIALIAPLIPEPVPGVPGGSPTKQELLALIKPLIPAPIPGSPDSADRIIKKIKGTLSYDDLKDLPNIDFYRGGPGYLREISDVSVTGIVAGQSIQWDGTRWIPYTPSGSSTHSVFGEVPTDSGDHTTFTLAHVPTSGTVRVYRGGAYQQAGAGNDYTISSNTVTLSITLATGEVLLVDYNY